VSGETERVAAVDCGTNTTRLLLAERGPGGLTERERTVRVTRLGVGVDRDGELVEEAVEQTLTVLDSYAEQIAGFGAGPVAAAATSAVRDAGNGPEFLSRAAASIGNPVAVLDGTEEAELTYAGYRARFPGDDRRLVCDIGGGSTELSLGRATPERVTSRQIGTRRLAERFGLTDRVGEDTREAARRMVRDDLHAARAALGITDGGQALVAVAATPAIAAAIHTGRSGPADPGLDGEVVPHAAVADLADRLAALPAPRRAAYPQIGRDRADVVAAGMVILSEVMAVFGSGELVVSRADLLDGLASRA